MRPLALIVMGGLTEASFDVAGAEDPEAAREEVRTLLLKVLDGIAVQGSGYGD